MTHSVFVVEDEPKIAGLLADYLEAEGHRGRIIARGDEVIGAVRAEMPDLILLDIMLPGVDGMTLCREIRAFSNVPIIMLTARIEEVDRLLGLDLGADDYICKPFSPREVMARIRAVFRRTHPCEGEILPLVLDEAAHRVLALGKPLDLTPNEHALMAVLLRRPGRVFSRNQLLDAIYDGFRDVSDRTVDSHIKNLRKKLAGALPDIDPIVSVYGVGYKLEL